MEKTPLTGPAQKLSLDISFVTLLKIAGFFLLIVILKSLWSLILLIFLAILLAVSLDPLLEKLEKKMPRWASILLIVVFLFGALTGVVMLVAPAFISQTNSAIEQFPAFEQKVLGQFEPGSGMHSTLEKILKNPAPNLEKWGGQILTAGALAIGGLGSFALVLVFMVYFLVDGHSAWEWALAFFPDELQGRLKITGEEVTKVVSAYILGQAITSVLCSIFVYVLLQCLHIPGAVMLAVVAGIFDILPIIGFIMTLIPALAFALSVSGSAALTMVLLFGVYHAVENYLLVPFIYGKRLRLSGLSVLFFLLAGAELAGILGAIVILPVIASYPIIEKHWLKRKLGSEVVDRHEDLDKEEDDKPQVLR